MLLRVRIFHLQSASNSDFNYWLQSDIDEWLPNFSNIRMHRHCACTDKCSDPNRTSWQHQFLTLDTILTGDTGITITSQSNWSRVKPPLSNIFFIRSIHLNTSLEKAFSFVSLDTSRPKCWAARWHMADSPPVISRAVNTAAIEIVEALNGTK